MGGCALHVIGGDGEPFASDFLSLLVLADVDCDCVGLAKALGAVAAVLPCGFAE